MIHSQEEALRDAILAGARRYFADCRVRVPSFIRKHYLYPGAWQTNKAGLGWDLLRAPLNLIWAPFYICGVLLASLARRLGWHRLAGLLNKLPPGLTTQVQKQLVTAVLTEILQRPEHEDESDPLEIFIRDEIERTLGMEYVSSQFDKRLHVALEDVLEQYSVTRIASSDITNTLFSTLVGAVVFKKFTPGGIGIGFLLASYFAFQEAVNNFPLGKTIGSWYYSVFTPDPSVTVTSISIGIVLLCLATFASFSGLITDPLQAALGIHKRRLQKLLLHLEKDFERETQGGYRPLDPYLARILELFDAAKAQLF